jgi:hypothetical protein
MPERHSCDQRIQLIHQLPLPTGVVQPAELACKPQSYAAGIANRVVIAANAGNVEIPQTIGAVEVH